MTETQEMVGDYYVVGPQMFATTPTPQRDTVLSWAGENFVVPRAYDRITAREILREFLENSMPYREAVDRLANCYE